MKKEIGVVSKPYIWLLYDGRIMYGLATHDRY